MRLFRKRREKMATTDAADSRETSLNPSHTDPTVAAFLHGRLTVNVIEARNVEGKCGSVFSKLERIVTSSVDGVDPYCSVKFGYNKIMQTPVVQNSDSPVWNSNTSIYVCHDLKALEFRVKAAKRAGPLSIISKVKHLSMLSIPAIEIAKNRTINGWFALGPYRREFACDDANEGTESDSDDTDEEEEEGAYGEIHVSIEYRPLREASELVQVPVPNTYFRVRHGVDVSLFQDADCPPGCLPDIPFHPDYQHGRCWVELADAIMSSTQFIYICGWAVWPELVMVRTDSEGEQWNGLTLGEMLIQKAEEGVCVCVMVWDELASGRFYKGLMGTHDEEVVAYFRKTPVHAIKVGRQNPKEGPLADLNDAAMFTHHQKNVIVTRMDQETGKNRVEAWVGGLDLTDGRYDNPHHHLFRTLDSLHAPPDFWQACATVSAESGPREPWHDIHAHVSGSAAWDILANFENRWIRQAPNKYQSVLHEHPMDEFVLDEEEESMGDGTWDVQVLRSINESATTFQSQEGLIVRRTASTDQSIHNAYIHHIRAAKHFIYIENQYFLGSSHMWESGQRGGFAANLVPIELAEKICAKIRADQRFCVYLNVPMYPEGPPDSVAVQEILSHQRKTIEMMTTRIVRTIQETGSDSSLSDWFNVFCLVNREGPEDGKGDGGTSEMEQKLAQSRRFMIYIHSKFAIFDDSVAIIGSANINSRSLDGSRDTEIAIAAWQPEHMATGSSSYVEGEEEEDSLPQGDVAAFRASVWSEHLGEYLEEFESPSSLECVSKIREMADANWQHFANDDDEAGGDMPAGHLALYPYEIDAVTGTVLSRQLKFPDFDTALVKGTATPGVPNLLTG